MASMATTTETALCIIPPEYTWEQIQAIRSIHDKACPRWMPHINLIYPFVPEKNFDEVKRQLEVILHQKTPFPIRFDQSSLHYFQQKGGVCTYHLRPTNTKDVVELQKSIQNQLSNIIKTKRVFEAHLTLGQTTTENISDVLTELKTQWKPIEFPVDRIYMISRQNHPEKLFTIKNEILLLNQEDEDPALAVSNLTMESVKASCMSYLCIIVPNEFSAYLIRLFKNTSLRPCQPFRIILNEYEDATIDADLRLKIESSFKFPLHFDFNSIDFDQTTSCLFLKPCDNEPIRRLNIIDYEKYDGRLTLGKIDKYDFDNIKDRYIRNYTSDKNTCEIARVHLTDPSGRAKFIFRLKS